MTKRKIPKNELLSLGDVGTPWFDAVTVRRSRRSLDGVMLPDDIAARMKKTCGGFRPYDDARVEFAAEAPQGLFKGIVGAYGRVSDAPHALIVIAGEGSAARAHAGYTGEGCILEATRLGLATCWVGGFFDRTLAAGLVDLNEGEQVVAISPVGYASHRLSLTDRSMKAFSFADRRKPAGAIAPDLNDSWPCWAIAAVECARLAPSARNRQPWRFRLSGGGLAVSRDTGAELPRVTKALDCGIAMLHAELGALAAGTTGRWADAEEGSLDVACFTPDAE